MLISYTLISFNNEGVFMGPTQGPHILQLYMGRSYFWRGLTSPDFPYFARCFLVLLPDSLFR